MTYHITFFSIFLFLLTPANPSQFSSLRPIDLSLQNPTSAAEDVQIPRSLSYQGKLTDDQGNPVSDSIYSITFRLFSVPSGGSAYWSETQSIQTRVGLFHTLLGSVTPIPYIPIDGNCYLEMQVNPNPPLTPRIRIVSSAYSYLTKKADSANYAQPIGTAGGDLTGNYPNPTIANNAVNSAKILDRTIAGTDINQMGANAGQVLKWTGSIWAPADDNAGGPPSGPAGGDLTGNYPNPTIANNAVNSAKILDGTIRGVDIAKPCTLTASVATPNAVLRIKNTGGGHGIIIDSAGYDGVSVYRALIGVHVRRAGLTGLSVDSAGEVGVSAWGSQCGGSFSAYTAAAVGLYANAYLLRTTDTAIYAYGRGYATGGWYTAGLFGDKEAPCIISPELTIVAYGTGKLTNGSATIKYPDIFKENIRPDVPVSITLTPRGNPNGVLVVSSTYADRFVVSLKSIPGWDGDSDVEFNWIAFGTLREYETSPRAKAEWERMMQERAQRAQKREIGGEDD